MSKISTDYYFFFYFFFIFFICFFLLFSLFSFTISSNLFLYYSNKKKKEIWCYQSFADSCICFFVLVVIIAVVCWWYCLRYIFYCGYFNLHSFLNIWRHCKHFSTDTLNNLNHIFSLLSSFSLFIFSSFCFFAWRKFVKPKMQRGKDRIMVPNINSHWFFFGI